ncbi:MAG: maleylacetoacetate isomerase [Betaproteobacteria bacterium]|nr:maleylacetoacetate isomerase [Betaproteobacteria bacterium]
MKLYGFWRSLATFRVRVALALKGLKLDEPEIPVDILQGRQFDDAYRKLNAQSVVPALIVEGAGSPLFQSMAILEYLEEIRPQPALLPRDALGRARVRGLSQICVSDGHPLIVPRIRRYLDKDLGLDESARDRWVAHWSLIALEAIEGHLAREPETGRFCHGDAPTLADICVASQVIAAKDYGHCDVSGVPAVMRVYGECMRLDAFALSHPQRQSGAPPGLRG